MIVYPFININIDTILFSKFENDDIHNYILDIVEAKLNSSRVFFDQRQLFHPKYKEEININSIPTIHGGIFPNTPKPSNMTLSADIKPEMIIWAEDSENLSSSILNLLDLNKSKKDISDEEKKTIQKKRYRKRRTTNY